MAMAEPYKLSAGALALLVHGIFFSMLYFSFSWQMTPPLGMVVDIWDSLPSDVAEQMPEQAQAEKQVIAPKINTALAAPNNADIGLPDKKKKLKEEQLKLDKSKAKQLAEKQAEQAERRMEEEERQAQARQAQARTQAQNKAQSEAAIAVGKVVGEYKDKIAAKIKRHIVLPPGVSLNIEANFNVTLLPSGEVLNVSLVKSSGNEAYDSAVERAILKAQPFPLPPIERNMFNRFRDLRLKFSPAESGQ